MPHILLIPEKMKLVGAWKMGPDSSSEVNSLFCFFLILLIPASFPWNGIENMPGNLGSNKKGIKVCILYRQWPLQGNNRGLNLIISSWSILQLFHTEKILGSGFLQLKIWMQFYKRIPVFWNTSQNFKVCTTWRMQFSWWHCYGTFWQIS